MIKIYFAGSIRGGREDASVYEAIIGILRQKGEVLTEHVGFDGLTPEGESTLTDNEIYTRDLAWLTASDIVVAEVTRPSLGVGFEIAKAVDMRKKVICLFRTTAGTRLSAMIAGCPSVKIINYDTVSNIVHLLNPLL
jgi:nucleoside 2-deoxyribosyltransferase